MFRLASQLLADLSTVLHFVYEFAALLRGAGDCGGLHSHVVGLGTRYCCCRSSHSLAVLPVQVQEPFLRHWEVHDLNEYRVGYCYHNEGLGYGILLFPSLKSGFV